MQQSLFKYLEDNASQFTSVGECRDTLYFGEYGYRYTGGKHEPKPVPELIQDLLKHCRPHLSNPDSWMNSCLITRYKTGEDYIPPHRDDEAFFDPESEIVTVSIGAKRTITFTDNSSANTKSLDLEDCSMLVCSRHSQDFWTHGIEKDLSVDQVRYSFTFRHVAPHFANSTVIIGDSNTEFPSFGNGKGSFGPWMPGKRISAYYINEVPEAADIGPYRNFVIHTGVNNIKLRNRRSNKSLADELEAKCKNIMETYPRSKIYISLLLPTKLTTLNYRVNEFNNMLLDMSHSYRSMYIIDNSTLCDEGGLLKEEFGRFNYKDGRYNKTDTLHIGKKGIRIFATTIKSVVVNGIKSRRRNSSKAKGHQQPTVGHAHRDGYQPSG